MPGEFWFVSARVATGAHAHPGVEQACREFYADIAVGYGTCFFARKP